MANARSTRWNFALLPALVALAGCPSGGKDTDETGETETGETGPTACALDMVALPGAEVFPEGVARTSDGVLYVGSVTTGAVFRSDCEAEATTFYASGGAITSAIGMLADESRGVLWVCASDLSFSTPPSIVGLSLEDASVVVSHAMPGAGFCNDLTLDGSGNLYATDSGASHVVRVAASAVLTTDSAEVWSEDDIYAVDPGAFGLNGLAASGDSHVHVVNTAKGELYRVNIAADGTAEAPVLIDLPRPLSGADGLKQWDATTLHLVENASDQVTKITLSGDSATLEIVAFGLDFPTTFAYADDGEAWVVESQFDHLFGGDTSPTDEPFRVVKVALDE